MACGSRFAKTRNSTLGRTSGCEATWLLCFFTCIRGAKLEIGADSFLNGCMVSAKAGVRLGRGVWLGPGTRVFDADQHDLDENTPERRDPVEIGDHTWVAADVAVMRGVSIGAHSVIGSRSVVTSDIPPHSLAFGSPARVRGTVGDRSQVPI